MSEVDKVYPEFFAAERDFLVAIKVLVDNPPQGFHRVDYSDSKAWVIESEEKIPGHDVAAYRFEYGLRGPFSQARALLPGLSSADGVPTQRHYGMARNGIDFLLADYPYPDDLALTVHELLGVVATAKGLGSFGGVLNNAITRALDAESSRKWPGFLEMKFPLPPEDIALVALELQKLAQKGV